MNVLQGMKQGMKLNSNISKVKQGALNVLQLPVPVVILFIATLTFLLLPQNLHAASTDKKILIVYQKAHGFSQQLIDRLQKDISKIGYQTEQMLLEPERLNLLKIHKQQLLIAIGSQTTKKLLEANIKTPILSALIPRHITKSLSSAHPEKKNWSSLLIDQPTDRQFHLITAVLGPHKNVGILLGPYTKDLDKALKKASIKTGHNVKIEEIESSDQLSTSLKALNNSTDVLLTLPDPTVYNKGTIRGILLLAYRNKLPIIGFSQAYVKAGAIAAIYSKPEQISEQLTIIIKSFFINKSFQQKKYYPDKYSVALNKNIARSLGIKLTSDKAIITKMKKAEKQ